MYVVACVFVLHRCTYVFTRACAFQCVCFHYQIAIDVRPSTIARLATLVRRAPSVDMNRHCHKRPICCASVVFLRYNVQRGCTLRNANVDTGMFNYA